MKKEVVLIIFLILGLSSSSERPSKRIGYYAGFTLSNKLRDDRHDHQKEKSLETKARLRELKLRGVLAAKLLIKSIMGK